MNEQRLMKIIEDMSEVFVNLKECKKVLIKRRIIRIY